MTSVGVESRSRCHGVTSEVVTRSLSARCKRGSKKAPLNKFAAEFAFSRHFATLVCYFAINARHSFLLNTLSAVVVGGTSLSGGVGGVHRTLLGVLIITILDDGLNLLGVNQYTQLVIKGLVVIAAVLVSQDRSKIMIVK